MRFANRVKEKKFLKQSTDLSKRKLFTVLISGLRRVGKTRLILETIKKSDLYFFINKGKTSESLLREYEETLKKRKILTEFESLKSWDDFFKVLFERFKGIVVFDEFQNFNIVDKSVCGTLQKYIDLNEEQKRLLILFSGSTVGLIKKLFSDSKEPLYGRIKRKMNLKPLCFSDNIKLCRELKINKIEEQIRLYSIFGGFPKYYVTIEDENLYGQTTEKIIEKLFFAENAALEDEISQILSLEFGNRSGIYYDILCALANGNTRISKISSYLGRKETSITRQMNELINYFELVGVKKSLINNKTLLFVKHPLMNFWFKFFYKNLSSYNRREKWLIEKIKNELNSYIGRMFENVCLEAIQRMNTNKNLPFAASRIGSWWGHYRNIKINERKAIEIDILTLSETTKQILFAECKWKDKVNAEKILDQLKEKAKYVKWHNDKRKEYYAIFAKSFKKSSKRTKEKNVYCYDLKDLKKRFGKKA